MEHPVRHQIKRGEPTPKGTVSVARGVFATPFAPAIIPGWATGTRENAVDDFRYWLTVPCTREPRTGALLGPGSWPEHLGVRFTDRPTAERVGSLAGKPLACTCPLSQPCHADVLLEWANRAREPFGPAVPAVMARSGADEATVRAAWDAIREMAETPAAFQGLNVALLREDRLDPSGIIASTVERLGLGFVQGDGQFELTSVVSALMNQRGHSA